MSTDNQKDKDQYIKDVRMEIKIGPELLSSFTIHVFPAFVLLDI